MSGGDLRFLNTVLALLEGSPSGAERILAAVDHEAFRQWCQRQQIGGLIYLVLEELSVRAEVPRALTLRLRATYLEQWARGERLRLQLAELARRMAEIEQDFLVLKGLPFAQRYYGAVDRRTTGDLDILVPGERAHAVAAGLEERGLIRRSPRWRENSATLQHVHEVDLELDGTTVELHHALRVHRAFRIDSAALWNEAISVELAGEPYRVLCDEHALLLHLLSLHTDIQIGQTNCRWLIDMLRILTRLGPEFAWNEFLVARSEEGTAKICINGLALFQVVTRSDERFPELSDFLLEHRDDIVLQPDRSLYLDLLRGASLVDRKAWPLRQYEGGAVKAFSWWLSGMPRRIAAKPAAFAKDLSSGPRSAPWDDPGDGRAGCVLERDFGVDPSTLQSAQIHFGSVEATLRYQLAEHRDAVDELFRLRPEPDSEEAGSEIGGDVSITIFGLDAGQLGLQILPNQPIVERPLEELTEIHEGIAHGWLYLRRRPVEMFIAIDQQQTSKPLLLHSLMVVLNKLFSLQGLYHLGSTLRPRSVSEGSTSLRGRQGRRQVDDQCGPGKGGRDGLFRGPHHAARQRTGISGFRLRRQPATDGEERDVLLRSTPGRSRGGRWWNGQEGGRHAQPRRLQSLHGEPRVADCSFPWSGSVSEIAPMAPEEAAGLLLEPVLERHRFAADDQVAFLDLFKRLVETTETWRLTLSPDLNDLGRLESFLRELS